MVKRLLVAVAFVTATVTLAACSGQQNSGAPCCSATGVTEAPPPAFAFAPSSAYYAEPIVLEANACVSVSASGIDLGTYERVGRAAPVGSSGRYTVEIADDAVGRTVFIRIFPDGDRETTLGLAALPAESAAAESTYRVAPIEFTPGATNRVGESTLELAMYCRLRETDALQNMVLADVRAAVSQPMAEAVDLTVGTALTALETSITRYRHGVNGTVGAVATEQRDAFADLRRLAEAFVDSCRDGSKPSDQSRISCQEPAVAEFYRAWVMSRLAAQTTFPRRAREHLVAWSFDMEKALQGDLTANAYSRLAQRQAWMMRFEAADQALNQAADAISLQPAARALLESNLETIRFAIVDPATDAATLSFLWSQRGANLVDAMKVASTQANESCAFDQFKITSDSEAQTLVSGLPSDPTHGDLAAAFFEGVNSFDGQNRSRLEASCTTLDDAGELQQLQAWTDIFTYLSINAAAVP